MASKVQVVETSVIIFWSYNPYLGSSDLEKTVKNIREGEKIINAKDEKINILQCYFRFGLVVGILILIAAGLRLDYLESESQQNRNIISYQQTMIKTHNEYICLFNEKSEEDKEESEKMMQLYAVIGDFLKLANERRNKRISFLSNEF
ncbi:20628_t:CDS:2 [Dentiscutata erythropus]|uniref:20628_t:CDS:1 n=1 Tax=Dentiscutata erythropus TaxID=1348616 RepID=A0A9N8Z0I0_9GLOM|nr:20628_t:CDS:2 [Dentiscutata erythropus]